MKTVHVKGACVRLRGEPVLRGANLDAARGEVVGLIGPNGAGKTTLLRAMLRLVPLTEGTLQLESQDVTREPAHKLHRLVSYLPQGQPIHWPLTVENVVALGRSAGGGWLRGHSVEDAEAIEQAISEADVARFRHRSVTTLSGGERARVLLARQLAAKAPILLADEPVAALDPYHQLRVMELYRRSAAGGRTVLLVLHDLALAARFCDRLVLLHEGETVTEGPPNAVLTPEYLQPIYRIRMEQLSPLGLVSWARA